VHPGLGGIRGGGRDLEGCRSVTRQKRTSSFSGDEQQPSGGVAVRESKNRLKEPARGGAFIWKRRKAKAKEKGVSWRGTGKTKAPFFKRDSGPGGSGGHG